MNPKRRPEDFLQQHRLEEIERYAAGQHVLNARHVENTLQRSSPLEREAHKKAWRAIRDQVEAALERAERFVPTEVPEIYLEGSTEPLTRSAAK